MKTVSIENFENRMKTIETKNIKKYGESLTWVSLYNLFNKCIIEVDEKTITFDENEYKKIRKRAILKEDQ